MIRIMENGTANQFRVTDVLTGTEHVSHFACCRRLFFVK